MKLSEADQKILFRKLKAIISLSRKQVSEPEVGITSLEGVGEEIWRDIDVDEYVRRERQWE